jgi:hypothetical protein
VDYLAVLHEEKRRTGSNSGAGEQTQQKTCGASSDIGAEQENHNVGRGPTLDRKWLITINSLRVLRDRILRVGTDGRTREALCCIGQL